MHISRFILVSKSPSFTFFHMNIHLLITLLHRRFVHIHTFFHCKIMCSCQLAICLSNISCTSYKRRLHHSNVAPPVPIWAEFTSTLDKICPLSIRAVTPFLSHASPPRLYIGIYYWEKFFQPNPHTRTWENPARFFCAEPLYVLYIAGKNVKNCKMRSCPCALDPRDFHFIWVKHGGKIW